MAGAPGITNPAGNLVLHIEGNLREYIGRQLGNSPYSRTRPVEFGAKNTRRSELVTRIEECRHLVPRVIESLDREALESEYPEDASGKTFSTSGLLTHLYGHLSWHLGQIDYLRRALSGEGAIKPAE
jgi:hypothetical protein